MKIVQVSLRGDHNEVMTTWVDVRPELQPDIKLTLKDMPGTVWTVEAVWGDVHDASDFDWHRKWDNNV